MVKSLIFSLPFVCGEKGSCRREFSFLFFFLFGFLASSVFVTAVDPANVSGQESG